MARTFFRKLLTYVSSEDDSDDALNEDEDCQPRIFIRRDYFVIILLKIHNIPLETISKEISDETCMHWKWKNCPSAWKGMYSVHIREPTIILEAVASYDLWIWHALFGMPGSHNDINVLERSFIFTELAQGRAPTVNYTINGHDYAMGYYLADGIYPKWRTFVKTIPQPRGNKNKYFAKAQESTRKDVERAFGVLQQRFAIIRGPCRMFKVKVLTNIMKACIILNNMIIEDERDNSDDLEIEYDQLDNNPPELSCNNTTELMDFIQRHIHIRDNSAHH